ncbi:MAG: hypothetical protein MK066_14940 [Crocinitomicaceae bacterium]|nr:hypothetical protein [Crocinitomicaceae bacterium]
MSVDTTKHVITYIGADYADQKDSQHLQKTTLRLKKQLSQQGLIIHNVLADAGYSRGENYAFFEEQALTSYIPPHGQYKGGPKGFTYHYEENYWECAKSIQSESRNPTY